MERTYNIFDWLKKLSLEKAFKMGKDSLTMDDYYDFMENKNGGAKPPEKTVGINVNYIASFIVEEASKKRVSLSAELMGFYLYAAQGCYLDWTDYDELLFTEELIAGENGPFVRELDFEGIYSGKYKDVPRLPEIVTTIVSALLEAYGNVEAVKKDIGRTRLLSFGREMAPPYEATPVGKVISVDDLHEYYFVRPYHEFAINNVEKSVKEEQRIREEILKGPLYRSWEDWVELCLERGERTSDGADSFDWLDWHEEVWADVPEDDLRKKILRKMLAEEEEKYAVMPDEPTEELITALYNHYDTNR